MDALALAIAAAVAWLPGVAALALLRRPGPLLGGEGAWIIAHSLFLGGGGYGLVTTTDAPEEARSSFGSNTLTLTNLVACYATLAYVMNTYELEAPVRGAEKALPV